MLAIQTMGRIFPDRTLSADMSSMPIFRAFGIALIRCLYSKPQTEKRWQSTSGFLNSRRNSNCNPLLHVGNYQIAGGEELRLSGRRRQGASRGIDRINIDRVANLNVKLRSRRIGYQI